MQCSYFGESFLLFWDPMQPGAFRFLEFLIFHLGIFQRLGIIMFYILKSKLFYKLNGIWLIHLFIQVLIACFISKLFLWSHANCHQIQDITFKNLNLTWLKFLWSKGDEEVGQCNILENILTFYIFQANSWNLNRHQS